MDHHHPQNLVIFVDDLGWSTTEESIMEYFKQYGRVVNIAPSVNKVAWLTIENPARAELLPKYHYIGGKRVKVMEVGPNTDSMNASGGRRIFIRGIPPECTEDGLKHHFSSYGQVIEHSIICDLQSGRPSGFGFVSFRTRSSAQMAVGELTNHYIRGSRVFVEFAVIKHAPDGGGSDRRGGEDRSAWRIWPVLLVVCFAFLVAMVVTMMSTVEINGHKPT